MTGASRALERTGLSHLLILLVALWAAPPAVQAAGADPLDLLTEIRSTQLDPASAVYIEGISIPVGDGALAIGQGTVIPTRSVAGRVVEWVFVGQARFQLDPPDAIEADQLEMFTGEPSLDVAVDSFVMVQADDRMVRRLLDRSACRAPVPFRSGLITSDHPTKGEKPDR